jgi:hypothetical protein
MCQITSIAFFVSVDEYEIVGVLCRELLQTGRGSVKGKFPKYDIVDVDLRVGSRSNDNIDVLDAML